MFLRKNYRKIALICLLAGILNILYGCDLSKKDTLRWPNPVSERDWLNEERSTTVILPLYFYTVNGDRNIEYREVQMKPGQTRAEVAMDELFKGSKDIANQAVPFISSKVGVYPDNVYVSGNTANVDLISSDGSIDIATLMRARVSVANTLIDLLGVKYVNLFYNGRAANYYEYLLGAMSRYDSSPDDYLKIIQQRRESGSYPIMVDVTLYFPDLSASHLICETRSVEINGGSNIAYEAVIRELLEGSADADLMDVASNNAMPEIYSTVDSDAFSAEEDNDDDDRRTSNSTFRSKLQITFEGKQTCDLSSAAVISTLTGLFSQSNVDSISVMYEGAAFDAELNSYTTRKKYLDELGDFVILRRIRHDEEYLEYRTKAVASKTTEDPLTLLKELLSDESIGVDAGSVRDVFISGDCVVVDFSSEYLSEAKAWSTTEKRLFVYSVVNTMTDIPGVNRVQFLEDGDTMTGMEPLILSGTMLRNPGLES